MEKVGKTLSDLLSHFSEIEDFRISRRKLYPLEELLFLIVSAVLSGCSSWEDISDFGEDKLDWLRKYRPFSNGTPSHDTLNRVMSHLDYRGFEECFVRWAGQGFLSQGTVINLDGKSVSGSATKKEQQTPRDSGGKGAVHLVQAWCSSQQLCLGQFKTEDKSNEITALPALLDMLEVKGSTITIDAMGCQRKIAEKIIGKEADYVIGLKSNQESLYSEAMAVFSRTQEGESPMGKPHEWDASGHGRIEKRTCRALPAATMDPSVSEKWKGLRSIIEVSSERTVTATGKHSSEKRYYISSLEVSNERFNEIVRGHWAIENQLHWSLDVQFGEDASSKREKNSAQNFGIMLKISLNLLKNMSSKISITRKRNRCARSDEFRDTAMKLQPEF